MMTVPLWFSALGAGACPPVRCGDWPRAARCLLGGRSLLCSSGFAAACTLSVGGGEVLSPVPFGRSWHGCRDWVGFRAVGGGRVPGPGASAAGGSDGLFWDGPDVPLGHEWTEGDLSFDELAGFFGPDALAV